MDKCEALDSTSDVLIRYPKYDFAKEKASIGRNSIHDYPAMIHFSLVDKLLDEFAHNCDIVYDPFCGSGTVLVESLRRGLTCCGTDINPLALLISKVRCSNIEDELLNQMLEIITNEFADTLPDIPYLTNASYWYNEQALEGLGKLRALISKIADVSIREFSLVCLSSLARKLSHNRKGEFKRVRVKDPLEEVDVDILTEFKNVCYSYAAAIIQNPLPKHHEYQLYRHDMRAETNFEAKFNIVITSPPYGDSMTTVAYGQYSSFGIEWLRGLNPFGDADLSLDRKCLGGILRHDIDIIKAKSAQPIVSLIAKYNRKRALHVLSFIFDLQLSIEQLCKSLKRGAIVCFVVGNRTVSNIMIPLDTISRELFEAEGLDYIETRVRTISMKRMPSRNSPTNVSGITSDTMSQEMIVILKKKDL